jgi:hypothetical protein
MLADSREKPTVAQSTAEAAIISFFMFFFLSFLETRFKVVRGVPESGSGKFSFP